VGTAADRGRDVTGPGRAPGPGPAPGSGSDPRRAARLGHRVCLSTLVIAAVAAYLAWRGWNELGEFGPARAVHAGRWELAGRGPGVRAGGVRV
jgi:hypothetical protein